MQIKNTLILWLAALIIMPSSFALAIDRTWQDGVAVRVYPSYGPYGPIWQNRHYNRQYYRNRNLYRPYYYGGYPGRYYLPWDRPRIEVETEYSGVPYFEPIAPIIVVEPQRQPRTLEQPSGFTSREQFLIDVVRHRATADRLLAAQELAEHEQITSVAVLIDTLINDCSAEVRIAAAQSLGKIGMPVAYEALMRVAESDTDDEIKNAAQEAAMYIQGKTRSKIEFSGKNYGLIHGAQKLPDYLENLIFGKSEIRLQTVRKLAQYKSNRSVGALINCLINDSDQDVRKAAAESLAEIGDEMAMPFLEAARVNDLEKVVRKAADKAVYKIGQESNSTSL